MSGVAITARPSLPVTRWSDSGALKMLGFRLPPAALRALQLEARRRNESPSAVARDVVLRWLAAPKGAP